MPDPEPGPPIVLGDFVDGEEDVDLLFDPSDLLANDRAGDGGALQIVRVDSAAQGTVRLLDSGEVLFSPKADASGLASFRYHVLDAHGQTATDWVFIDLAPVNDAPWAVGEQFEGMADIRYEFSVPALLANDGDVESGSDLRLTRIVSSAHAQAALSQGYLVVQPEPGYAGEARIDYEVSDPQGLTAQASLSLNLAPAPPPPPPPPAVNHAPVASDDAFGIMEDERLVSLSFAQLLANDRDADSPVNGDALRITQVNVSDGPMGRFEVDMGQQRVLYQPASDYAGSFDFSYVVQDEHGAQDRGDVAVTVYPVNDLPVVSDTYAPSPISGRVDGQLSAQDPDGPGPWVWSVVSRPDFALFDLDAQTGAWSMQNLFFTPSRQSFRVSVSDGIGATQYQEMVLMDGVDNGERGANPVLIDLHGNGFDLAPVSQSPVHIVTDSGERIAMGWVRADDAVLAWNHDGDPARARMDEIRFVPYQAGATSDLEGLRAFDSNQDGWLDGADAQWPRFGLLDTQGAFTPIERSAVQAISLTREGTGASMEGHAVLGTSEVRLHDGHSVRAADAWLAIDAPQADAQAYEQAMRGALVFAQTFAQTVSAPGAGEVPQAGAHEAALPAAPEPLMASAAFASAASLDAQAWDDPLTGRPA